MIDEPFFKSCCYACCYCAESEANDTTDSDMNKKNARKNSDVDEEDENLLMARRASSARPRRLSLLPEEGITAPKSTSIIVIASATAD